MQDLALKAEDRSELGKGGVGRLRKTGKIPAVIYGIEKPIAVSLDEKDFLHKFRYMSEHTIVPVETGGKKIEVLVKDYQYDIVRDKILHVDLYQIIRGKTVKAKAPIKLVGQAIGQREGGVTSQKLMEVEVECMPRFMPSEIELDISSLKVGESLTVANLKKKENVVYITKQDTIIVTVKAPQA